MARVNYQREKRLKDLERQRKQEEKRARKLQKIAEPETAAGETAPEGEAPPSAEPEA